MYWLDVDNFMDLQTEVKELVFYFNSGEAYAQAAMNEEIDEFDYEIEYFIVELHDLLNEYISKGISRNIDIIKDIRKLMELCEGYINFTFEDIFNFKDE